MSETEKNERVYLGNNQLLVRTQWGGHIVVPTYNVDVAVGMIRDGIHEPWTTRLVQELLKSGDTYVNVGANFGYYTSLAGSIVGSKGKIFTYEANPEVFVYLMKTIMYSGLPGIASAYNRAVYKLHGVTLDFSFDFQYIGGGHLRHDSELVLSQSDTPMWTPEALNSLLDEDGQWIVSRGLYNFIQVETVTLDKTLGDQQVDLIQCDAESAEPYIILGATQTIRNSPNCKIIFEWSGYSYTYGNDEYKKSVNEMWNFLAQEGFVIRFLRPFTHPDGAIELGDPIDLQAFLQAQHGDYLAVRP